VQNFGFGEVLFVNTCYNENAEATADILHNFKKEINTIGRILFPIYSSLQLCPCLSCTVSKILSDLPNFIEVMTLITPFPHRRNFVCEGGDQCIHAGNRTYLKSAFIDTKEQ